MTLPATYGGVPVVLWTPETADAYVAAQTAYIAEHPDAHVFDIGIVYANETGAIVSPVGGLAIGGSVLHTAEEMAEINAAQEAVNEGSAPVGEVPPAVVETPMAVIPQAHISEFQKLLDAVESIPAHIRAFFAEHFGKHVA